MTTPIERIAALMVGTVEYVSPDQIKVLLELDAPQATALNTGVPIGFPRINSYVLIPNEAGAVVALVAWLGVEPSSFPKRTGLKDFGLIDLPYPLRKMSLVPLGTLSHAKAKGGQQVRYRLERGVAVFPSVGDPVLLPTSDQLRSIVESEGVDRRVTIGTSPLAGSAVVSVDPDKIFGRHLAVLGNTGSGKSCTVAGLIRWSLKAAEAAKSDAGREGPANARFIILDPNGEYTRTFSDLTPAVRVFQVPPVDADHHELSLPAWMWNSNEWSSFAAAAPGAQRPILLQALRDLRAGAAVREPVATQVSRYFRSCKAQLEQLVAQGVTGYQGPRGSRTCGSMIRNIEADAARYESGTETGLSTRLGELAGEAKAKADAHYWSRGNGSGYNDFSETDVLAVMHRIDAVLAELPAGTKSVPPSEDAPVQFDVGQMADHLEQLAGDVGGGSVAQFVATLAMRVRMMLADRRLGPIVMPDRPIAFEKWLEDYVGVDSATTGQIAILDLSLVPADVIHVVIAVVARIVFEATQRYRKLNTVELPTVLVLEEAHTFVRRSGEDEQSTVSPAQMCRQTFERIAREGRKFGLGLVLSSQRPSELSATVLAQCNTFILHRIVNDRDQELVGRLVPDNLGGLLRELPSLPARQAILLGWATAVPVLVEIAELPEEHRPHSSDPKFWDVWTGVESRPVDWKKIAEDWTS